MKGTSSDRKRTPIADAKDAVVNAALYRYYLLVAMKHGESHTMLERDDANRRLLVCCKRLADLMAEARLKEKIRRAMKGDK